MDLDWITLYDYITILSQSEIKEKINKFYESFYPLKLKNSGRKKLEFKTIQRGGLLGIVATYISRVLSILRLYLEAEYFLNEGKTKQLIRLYKLFVEIEYQNLEASLRLEETVYVIQEAYKYFIERPKESDGKIEHEKKTFKGFLEIKLLCSLKRLFEFYYNLDEMKNLLEREGYLKIYSIIRLNSIETFNKARIHLKLFPQISGLLIEILKFFAEDEKEPFNFHSHLIEQNKKGVRKTFPEIVKLFFSIIPHIQKQVFLNLNDEAFYDFLVKSGLQIPKEPIENYSRSEEEMNSLISEEENFLESILVSEIFRGRPEWKKKVMEQMVNLSIVNHPPDEATNSKRFRFSEDFPLFAP